MGDPEISTRIAQYEMAFRMQTSVPEFTDLSGESAKTFELYGPESHNPGTFAANCLLARRLAERNVRFIQIFHRGWDQHGDLPRDLPLQCRDVDQACRALDHRPETARAAGRYAGDLGGRVRPHDLLPGHAHQDQLRPRPPPACFTIWMAGGGMKRGLVYGETDDFGYNIVRNPVHVHDLNATLLYCLGIDHTQLTYRFQGRDFRHGRGRHDGDFADERSAASTRRSAERPSPARRERHRRTCNRAEPRPTSPIGPRRPARKRLITQLDHVPARRNDDPLQKPIGAHEPAGASVDGGGPVVGKGHARHEQAFAWAGRDRFATFRLVANEPGASAYGSRRRSARGQRVAAEVHAA